MSRLLPGLAAAAFLSLTGCAGLRYQPELPAPPRAPAPPLPLRVGLVVDNPNPALEATGLGAPWIASQSQLDLGRTLAEALRGSRLFQDLRYPMPHTMEALQNTDLILNASFKRAFNADPAKFPKAFLTGLLLFLPSSFIEYDDHYTASARLTVDDKHGNWIKEYTPTADVTASWKIFSEMRSYKEGPGAAAQALAYQLTEALIADRAVFEKAAKDAASRPAAAAAPRLAPAAAEPEPAPQESAALTAPAEEPAGKKARKKSTMSALAAPAEEPAAQPAAPAAAEPTPAPAAEEPPKPKTPTKTFDDQL